MFKNLLSSDSWPEICDSQGSGTRFHKFSSFACWLEDFEIRHAFLINIHKDGANMQITRDFIFKCTMHLQEIYFEEASKSLKSRKRKASPEFYPVERLILKRKVQNTVGNVNKLYFIYMHLSSLVF
jgi:hypothetical protein